MSGFKASQAVSKMSYDFTGIEVADEDTAALLAKAKGVTPEPSPAQVRHFHATQRELLNLSPDTTQEEVVRAMAAKTEDQLLDMDEDIMDMMAEVTSGKPSRDLLAALPFRVREAYYGYLMGELANFLATSGTTRNLRAVGSSG